MRLECGKEFTYRLNHFAPDLAREQLVGPGDLSVTIDCRDILAEILRKRLNNPLTTDVFPGYTITERSVVVSRN